MVQFSSRSGPPGGAFSGRVEHLTSGERARFETCEELFSILERMLARIDAGSI